MKRVVFATALAMLALTGHAAPAPVTSADIPNPQQPLDYFSKVLQDASARLEDTQIQMLEQPENSWQRQKAELLTRISIANLGTWSDPDQFSVVESHLYQMIELDVREHIGLLDQSAEDSASRMLHARHLARMLQGDYSQYIHDVFVVSSPSIWPAPQTRQHSRQPDVWQPDTEAVRAMILEELKAAGASEDQVFYAAGLDMNH